MELLGLRLELFGYILATNLTSFGLGMLLVMIKFDVVGFLYNIQPYLLLVILFGFGLAVYWTFKLA